MSIKYDSVNRAYVIYPKGVSIPNLKIKEIAQTLPKVNLS